MTEAEQMRATFEMILAPAIDIRAPYAKVMIDKLIEAALPLPAAEAVGEEALWWRCFHCDEVFTDHEEARQHFGYMEDGEAEGTACQLTKDEKGLVSLLREAWNEVRRCREEDTDLHRSLWSEGAKAERERREWGDKEYAKGLADGRAENGAQSRPVVEVGPGTIEAWEETAAQYARNADYYRGLVVQIGEMLGPDAYTADDGGKHQDVLCAKVPELVKAALQSSAPVGGESETFDLVAHLNRQRRFSEKTFGPGTRLKGVCDHLRKEMAEIEANPSDISEYADVLLLALDLAWRAGFSSVQICDAIDAKQTKNEARDWPDWRTQSPDKAIEHVKPTPNPPATAAGGEVELLPCPFCGGAAERIDIEDGENAGGSCIACTQCQASSNVEFERKENFVSRWNARAAIAALGEREGPDLLAELAKHPSWEIDNGHRNNDEDEPYGWRVHERTGNRNDQEWRLIGFGETPTVALQEALPASQVV